MNKLLTILRAVPGSGKSTFAKLLLDKANDRGMTVQSFSTDNFFMVDGKYVFNAHKLGYNHQQNLEGVKRAIVGGIDLAIVDNTNLSERDFKPYVDFAKDHNRLIAEVVFIPDTFENHVKRTIHNVPSEKIQQMISRFRPVASAMHDFGLDFYISPTELPGSESHLKICENILDRMQGG
jgi:tRNA uridine 5-carbamoylmethylation protein Kti12